MRLLCLCISPALYNNSLKSLTWISVLILYLPFVRLQAQPDPCEAIPHLINTLDHFHVQKPVIDDRFSEKVYDAYLKLLDPRGIYLTKENLNALNTFRHSLDDDPRERSCQLLKVSTAILRQQLQATDSLIKAIRDQGIKLTGTDSVQLSYQPETVFTENYQEWVKRWKRGLRYQSMYLWVNLADSTMLASDSPTIKSPKQYLDKVADKNLCKIQQILNHPHGFEAYIAESFLKAISTAYDPHSLYFSPEEKNSFESSLATDAPSFGLELSENQNGDIQIARLVPGGPAWKSNELHKGDVLIEVDLPGEAEVDLFCTDVATLSSRLSQSRQAVLKLTVKKQDGLIRKVSLLKEKMAVEENIVNSFVLKGEKNIGYMYLPGFYTEWEDAEAKGCANDVARELIKLQSENIDGLILDLRYNGGGSMYEALDLAGIFIEEGPLSVMKDMTGELSTLKDGNRGTIFDGPLIIMINGASASASEIFASCLQDYNRAIIVGATSYGKSTGQVMLPVNRQIPQDVGRAFGRAGELGYVKTTIHRYYRINGQSHQLEGVVPDVALPDMLSAIITREERHPSALSQDAIDKPLNYDKLEPLPIGELVGKSEVRRKNNRGFRQIQNQRKSLEKLVKGGFSVPFKPGPFARSIQKNNQLLQSLSPDQEIPSQAFTVDNHQFDRLIIQMDNYRKEINARLLDKINKDLYIEEAYHIILDLIELTNP